MECARATGVIEKVLNSCNSWNIFQKWYRLKHLKPKDSKYVRVVSLEVAHVVTVSREAWLAIVRDAYEDFCEQKGAETEDDRKAAVHDLAQQILESIAEDVQFEFQYETAPAAMDNCEKQLMAVVSFSPLCICYH